MLRLHCRLNFVSLKSRETQKQQHYDYDIKIKDRNTNFEYKNSTDDQQRHQHINWYVFNSINILQKKYFELNLQNCCKNKMKKIIIVVIDCDAYHNFGIRCSIITNI